MRNPIRLKNLSLRFAPVYLAGILVLAFVEVSWRGFWLGMPPLLAGLVLRGWGAGHLIKNERFAITGPYAYVRHPLYLGTALVAVGFASMLGGWPTIAVLVMMAAWFFLRYFPRKERIESQRLEARYGQVYRDYREQVPALLPKLEPWRLASVGAERVETNTRWSAACYDENNELGTLLAASAGICLFALRASLG